MRPKFEIRPGMFDKLYPALLFLPTKSDSHFSFWVLCPAPRRRESLYGLDSDREDMRKYDERSRGMGRSTRNSTHTSGS
jgi:hypothetical protein